MANSPNKELLEATHTFPGPYTVKAFGPHDQAFVDAVTDAARTMHSGDDEMEVAARASSKGNHLCVSVTVVVEDADAITTLYDRVRGVGGLRMLL